MYGLIELVSLFDQVLGIDYKLLKDQSIRVEYFPEGDGYSSLLDQFRRCIVDNDWSDKEQDVLDILVMIKFRYKQDNSIYTVQEATNR